MEARTVLSAIQVEACGNKGILNEFDFVFLDTDKKNLVNYFDMVLPMVRKNGIIAANNMCYPEEYRIKISNYIRHLRKKPHIQSVTLPLGNGEEITVKLVTNNLIARQKSMGLVRCRKIADMES